MQITSDREIHGWTYQQLPPWVFDSIEDATGHAELFCNLLAFSGSNCETS